MRRFLHSLPEAPELAGHNIVRATPVVDPRKPQVPGFKVLGLGSLLQVQLPPSIKLFAKRNALTGVLGSFDSFASRLHIAKSPLLRLFARQPVVEQTIVGTQPLVCLLGSTSATARHLTAIELDGSLDWIVTRPGQIHAYCGTQMRLSPRTGWRIGSLPYTHTIVSGRGWLSLASPLSVVQFQVPSGESVLIQKNHLNAYTVDTNAAQAAPAVQHLKFDFSQPQVAEPVVAAPATKPPSRLGAVWQRLRAESAWLWYATRSWLSRQLRSGNTSPFVKINGPSTVLVSASAQRPRAQPAAEPERTTPKKQQGS